MRKPDPRTAAAGRLSSRLGFALVAYLFTGMAGQAAAVTTAQILAPSLLDSPLFNWLCVVLGAYVLGVPVFLFLMGRPPRTGGRSGRAPGPASILRAFLAGLAAIYGGNIVTLLVMSLLGKQLPNPVEAILEYPPVLAVLLTCVLAPLCEELMFRGVVLEHLRPYGDRFAVLASALLFGLIHGNLSQFLYAAAFGVVIGAYKLRTGRLWPGMLVHSGINLLASALLPLITKLGGAGEAASGFLVLAALVGGFGIMAVNRRRLPGAEAPAPWRAFFLNPGMVFFLAAVVYLFHAWF